MAQRVWMGISNLARVYFTLHIHIHGFLSREFGGGKVWGGEVFTYEKRTDRGGEWKGRGKTSPRS